MWCADIVPPAPTEDLPPTLSPLPSNMASLLVHSPPSHDSLYADGSEKLLGVPDASSWHPPAGSKDPPRSATPRSGGGPEKRPSLLAMLQDYWWLIVIVCLLVLTVLWQLMVWHAFRGRSAATCTQQIGGDYLGVEPTCM